MVASLPSPGNTRLESSRASYISQKKDGRSNKQTKKTNKIRQLSGDTNSVKERSDNGIEGRLIWCMGMRMSRRTLL